MGYSLKLGYAKEVIDEGSYREVVDFERTTVMPFRAGSTVILDPVTPEINKKLDISPWEAGGDTLDMEQYEGMPLAVDDDGKAPAEMDVTFNYSKRIHEVTGGHLGDLHGQKGSEAAAMLMQLIAGLEPNEEEDSAEGVDYWTPTDGNIQHLAETLLDWTFQHPDAVFYSVC